MEKKALDFHSTASNHQTIASEHRSKASERRSIASEQLNQNFFMLSTVYET